MVEDHRCKSSKNPAELIAGDGISLDVAGQRLTTTSGYFAQKKHHILLALGSCAKPAPGQDSGFFKNKNQLFSEQYFPSA